jgi:hypothetical protein
VRLELLHGVLGLAGDLGRLGGREPIQEAQRHDVALVARQAVQRVGQLVAIERAVHDLLGALLRDLRRVVQRADDLARPGPQEVDHVVARDAVQPGRERQATELVAADPLVDLEEHLLGQVLGDLALPVQVAHQVAIDLRRELLVELPERLAVAAWARSTSACTSATMVAVFPSTVGGRRPPVSWPPRRRPARAPAVFLP